MSDSTEKATIVIGSRHALRIFTQMLEKHEKGTLATKNTVESFGGDSHAMDAVVGYIADWRRQTALQGELLAPKGAEAVAGTPMGDALAAAGADGIQWSADVPEPRPQAGQLVRWPTGQAEGITTVIGYRPETDAFAVVIAEHEQHTEVVHSYVADGSVEWLLLKQLLDYTTPRRIIPIAEQVAAAVEAEDDELAELDARAAAIAAAESPAEAAAREADAAHPLTPPKKAAKKGKQIAQDIIDTKNKQRARNTAAAGLSAGRAVPKPGAASKKGGK